MCRVGLWVYWPKDIWIVKEDMQRFGVIEDDVMDRVRHNICWGEGTSGTRTKQIYYFGSDLMRSNLIKMLASTQSRILHLVKNGNVGGFKHSIKCHLQLAAPKS